MNSFFTELMDSRRTYSKGRLKELRERIGEIKELERFPTLTIFGAGSYARLEASEHSDIDMFFLHSSHDSEEPRTNQIRSFSKILDVVEQMDFPKFSNDGEYLKLLHIEDMIKHLGDRSDDYENHFTTRMLLLLESQCLFADQLYNEAIDKTVDAYFRDYHDHKGTFMPIFLLNDIIRYWKTLCLNYENRRNQPADDEDRKLKQKIRNFKLKYSRMTTCFATIAALSCLQNPITKEHVIDLSRLTPQERLLTVAEKVPTSTPVLEKLFLKYDGFLKLTGLSTLDLQKHFKDKKERKEAFELANSYGDTMYELLKIADSQCTFLRYLVI